MAKPRVFISSTYFDLKSVRADLEHFVREQGFDPVLHERGAVAYGSQEALEQYCYKEIENCDILISIIGGRFGSKSNDSIYSISQTELKVALDQAKQLYIFVENGVYHEYRTFDRNRDAKIRWASVDNEKIFEFLSEVYALKNNNPIQPFETSFDITSNLKEQWAGLFQRLLAQQAQGIQASMFLDLRQSIEAARSLVDVASSHADRRDEVVSNIILLNHPLFSELRRVLGVQYRFVVETLDELNSWLSARGYSEEILPDSQDYLEWYKNDSAQKTSRVLKVSKNIFDDKGKLRPFSMADWKDNFVSYNIRKLTKSVPFGDLDDDIPF